MDKEKIVSNATHTKESFLGRLKETENGCLEWQGGRHEQGYGLVGYKGRCWRAHRLSYTFFNGKITKGLFVMHKCDNPPCCNPDHLELGTPKQNMRDSLNRKRFAVGERQGLSRLTKNQAKEIQKAKSAGGRYWGSKEYAKKFGVHVDTVSQAANGRTWKHG